MEAKFDLLAPCPQHKNFKCPPDCGNEARKVQYIFSETDEPCTLKMHQACTIHPLLDIVAKYGNLESKEEEPYKVKMEPEFDKMYFMLYTALVLGCGYTIRTVPPEPYGFDKTDALRMNDYTTEILSKCDMAIIEKLFEFAFFFDNQIAIRLLSCYLARHLIAENPIDEVQSTFNLPINTELSTDYSMLIDNYSLDSYIFHPQSRQVGYYNKHKVFVGFISEHGDTGNWSGTGCSGEVCEAETTLNSRNMS